MTPWRVSSRISRVRGAGAQEAAHRAGARQAEGVPELTTICHRDTETRRTRTLC
jgi:hypothetical protein